MKNKHIGSNFDDFLREEGILEEVEAAAVKNLKGMRTFQEYLIETLQDPEEANAYLAASLEEFAESGDGEALQLALDTIKLAKEANPKGKGH